MSLPSKTERFARNLKPPYHIVSFVSHRQGADNGYNAMAEQMVILAEQQAGYLGHESTRDDAGFGITNSYWMDEASILAWRKHVTHEFARKTGNERWYDYYEVRIGRIERAYAMGHSGFGESHISE